jgi:hypothetical protein
VPDRTHRHTTDTVPPVTRGLKSSDAHCRPPPLPSRSWARAPEQFRHSVGSGECRDCVGASRSAVSLNGTSFSVCQDPQREARRRVCHHNPCDARLLQSSRGQSGVCVGRTSYAGSLQALYSSDSAISYDIHLLRVAPQRRLERLDSDIHESRVRQTWSSLSTGTIFQVHETIAVATARYESLYVTPRHVAVCIGPCTMRWVATLYTGRSVSGARADGDRGGLS